MKNIKLPQCSTFKKFVIGSITLWFFSSQTIYCQYQSIFGQHSTEWIFEWHNLDIRGQDTVYVLKDTVVNSITWKKIMVKNNSSSYIGGLLREDTSVGKVWYKGLEFFGNSFDTTEILSFDFSLEVNDSFDISNMYKGSNPFYSKVVSTYYFDDIKYIEFEDQLFSGFPFLEPYVFVEGIGGIMGVLWKQYFGLLQAQYLLCSYKDGVRTSFMNKRYNGNCSLITSIFSDQEPKSKIAVFPNPTSGVVFIGNTVGLVFDRIQIVNSLGEIKLLLRESSTIDLTEFPSGVYTLQFISVSGAFYSYSIVKI